VILPVILSGGSGTRLWPLSRRSFPKQFIPLVEEASMFQSTIRRLQGLDGCQDPLVICNEDHRFLVAEQLRELGIGHGGIFLEPIGRNTAPAITCAALAAAEEGDPLLLVMPSDHVVADKPAFHNALKSGCIAAEGGGLVTFGIVATRPETGYGYIRRDEKAEESGGYAVQEFVEKPDIDTAKKYLASGQYYWNSGIFLFKASVFLKEMARLQPDILAACTQAYEERGSDLDFQRLEKESFTNCRSESIDYAVMEKTALAKVVPLDAGWSDVGAWSALWEVSDRDENGNVQKGDVKVHDAKNCYFHSEHRLIAGVGVSDLVVVETADAVLVADKSKVQDVKEIVNQLQSSNRVELEEHVRVYRPWGNYQTTDENSRYKVKRIVVKPGEQLSLQKHHHRSEHWVVVSGTAIVTRGDDVLTLTEDQSVYIPLGTKHRLENPGKIPLEIIEVQTGTYLGEDDIVRFEDTYGRSN